MRLRLLLSLSLLLLARQLSLAQLAPADDFFHGGAQLYITNNIPQAKEVVAQGRKLYPDDEKLKKLEELLNQKQQQQNQQQQQSPNYQQQKSDEQKKQPPPEQNDSQPKPDEKKKPDEQKNAEEKKNSADQPKDDAKDEQEAQPMKPGEMTPEEARRLLDAQKGKEQLLQLKPPEKPRNNSRPVKDW